MPSATKKSKTGKARLQATSKSKPTQASSGGTRKRKRKRDQDEEYSDGKSTKKHTPRATAEAVEGVTTQQANATDKNAEGETTRQTRGEGEVVSADEQ
jgi:hypothetical protein